MSIPRLGASLALLLAWPSGARAAEPTRSTCTVSSLQACPAGDLAIRVVVKSGKTPLSGSRVTLDVSGCPAVKLGAARPGDPYAITDGCRVSLATGAEGVAELRVRAGGAGSSSRIVLHADGVMIAERAALASPDQNGDLLVDEADLAILAAKAGERDRSADLDGDGRVTARDVAAARRHLGHRADVVTPALTRTWGDIKPGYR